MKVDIRKRKKENKKIMIEQKITKLFNNHKIFLHLCLLLPKGQADGQIIHRIDAHLSNES